MAKKHVVKSANPHDDVVGWLGTSGGQPVVLEELRAASKATAERRVLSEDKQARDSAKRVRA